MERWIPILIISVISIVGFIKLIFDYKKISVKRDFTFEFTNKYREWGNELLQRRMNEELYEWLRIKSSKMQGMMGSYGVVDMFQRPFSGVAYTNYHIIYSGLSEIRREFFMANSMPLSLSFENLHELIRMADDCLLSYMGALEDLDEKIKTYIRNPTIWFREGIRLIVILPISFIYWSGIIKYHTYSRLSNNFLIRIITLVVGIIGFVSSVITIILEYESSNEIYNKFREIFPWS